MALSSIEYEVSWLSKFFHSFPHVDLTFAHVNSTFHPGDTRYREALVFWAAVPVLWLLLTLLVFLMYFCYRCCQRDVEKKQRVPCLRWSMAILAILTCCAVGVGIYGNLETIKGIDQFKNSLTDAQVTVQEVQNDVSMVETDLNNSVEADLRSLLGLIKDQRGINGSIKAQMEDLTNTALAHASAVSAHISAISLKTDVGNMGVVIDQTSTVAFYSWLSTLIFLCWMILLCLLLLIGIGRSSKCTLLVFCAFGIFTMVLCWMSAGVHTGVSVGAGDFCVDPDAYVESLYKDKKQNDVIRYYIECKSALSASPYGNALNDASEDLRKLRETVLEIQKLAKLIQKSRVDHYIDEVLKSADTTSEKILHLTALVECTNLHKDYRDAVIGLCSIVFPGLVFLLLSFMLCGLLFTILVIMASRAWRHFSRRKGYREVDEDDPFLPPADNATSYYSFTRQGRPPGSATAGAMGGNVGGPVGGNRDQMSLQRRPTPPPAVQPTARDSPPPQYNSYDYRSPTEVHHHHHMGADPASAPMARHDEYPTFGRESHA